MGHNSKPELGLHAGDSLSRTGGGRVDKPFVTSEASDLKPRPAGHFGNGWPRHHASYRLKVYGF